MRRKIMVSLCVLLLSLSACSSQESKKEGDSTKNQRTEQEESQNKEPSETPTQKPTEAPTATKANTANMGSSMETFQPSQPGENASNDETEETQGLSNEQLYQRFYQKFYGTDGTVPDIDVMENVLTGERIPANLHSKYDSDMNYYWEQVLGITDVSNVIEPLFFTDMKYYTAKDFENLSPTVIHLAKNEIYAKHGYIFKDEDLNQFFLRLAWYQPRVTSEEFDVSVFNKYEKANLKLLSELDKQ